MEESTAGEACNKDLRHPMRGSGLAAGGSVSQIGRQSPSPRPEPADVRPPVRAPAPGRPGTREPHPHCADVPVLGAGRRGDRLAPDASRPARAVGRRAPHPGGDGGLARGADLPGDLGLYDDATERALARVLDAVRGYAPIPVAIQINHAGRKASSRAPGRAVRRSPRTPSMAGRPKPPRRSPMRRARCRRMPSTRTG